MSAIDDLVTNGEVTQGDLIKARAELAALRASLATATRTAEVWERQHREAVDIIEQREASIREFLFVQRLPENEKDRRLAAQAAQIEAMDLERGELMLARDYARDEA